MAAGQDLLLPLQQGGRGRAGGGISRGGRRPRRVGQGGDAYLCRCADRHGVRRAPCFTLTCHRPSLHPRSRLSGPPNPEHRWSGMGPTWRQWPRAPSRRRASLAGSCAAVAAARAERDCGLSCASAPAWRASEHTKSRVCRLGLGGGWLALPTWPKLVRRGRWGGVRWGAPRRRTQAAATRPSAL